MKKTYFKTFGFQKSKHAPEFSTRRFNIKAGGAAFKSGGSEPDDDDDDADDDADDDVTIKPEEARLLRTIKKRVSGMLKGVATKKEIRSIMDQFEAINGKDDKNPFPVEALRELADTEKGALAMLTAQGLEITRMKTAIDSGLSKDMSVREQCKKYLESNKAVIGKIANRDARATELPQFEIKLDFRAAADNPMKPSTVMPGGTTYLTKTEIQPGIISDLRAEPTFWDFIKKGSTSSETYVWVNKKPTDGAAAFIAPGVYKPNISFTIETELSKAKKIAVSEKMAIELLQDLEGFISWVETELYYMLMIKVNEVLSSGTETSTSPAGIRSLSTAYDALTGVKTSNPNYWDCVKAGVTMLRVKRFRGTIVAFCNPVDVANGVMTKAQNQGQLFIPPVTGAVIVEDLNMPLGYIQFVAIDYYKILIYKAFTMAWGLENDDFTKNLVTVIGEMRLHQFHSSNHDGFAVYDTYQNIVAAITEAP